MNLVPAKRKDPDYCDACAGGCWYCNRKDDDDLVFCSEFDTFVHVECAKNALNNDPADQEASIICSEVCPP